MTENKQKSLARVTLGIAIPLAAQNLIGFAVNMMDTVMLGQLGDTFLSASALANQLFFLITLAVGGIAGGSNVLVAQAWGKRDRDTIYRMLAYTYRLAVLFALLMSVLAIGFPAMVMRIFTTDGAVIAEGAIYLRIIGFSYLLYAITNVTTATLQAVHTVKISVIASAVAMILNITLNWVLIFGNLGAPEMGIAGAALATLIARVVEFVIVIVYVYVKEDKLHLRIGKLRTLDKSLARKYFVTGMPVILNELFWALGDSALAVVLGRMGTEVVAANSIVAVATNFASIFCRGVTAACCIVVAGTIGAGNRDELPMQKRFFQRIAIGLGILAGGVLLILRPVMLRMYNVDAITIEYASQILRVEAVLQVFRFFQLMNMMGLLRGGGDVKFAMMNDLVFLWGVTVPLGFLCGLVLHWPPVLVYCVIKLDQVIKAVTSEVRLRSGRWIHDTTQPG